MKKSKYIIMILLLLFMQVQSEDILEAYAKMKIGIPITLTQPGQILESISYNGIIVEAAYTNGAYSGSDPVFSCAAFVKKFYSMVYGIEVNNLLSKDSVPLVYYNKGSFSLTDQPRIGDIVRDNTRTHWAIVKAVDQDVITVVQQNYRSGNTAWINCTIERSDTGYSYFTYSNRVEDSSSNTGNNTAGEPAVPVQVPGEAVSEAMPALGIGSEIQEGTYRLFQVSNSYLLTASEKTTGWLAQLDNYRDSENQLLSIVSLGESEYALQFLSDRRFLAISDSNELITTENLEQSFVFVIRDNGCYTLSPASNRNKVIALSQVLSQNNQPCLTLQDYTGSLSEFWSLGFVSSSVLTLVPGTSISKKTLYMGYQDYQIGITQLKKNASVTYTSDDPAIAEVSNDGTVRAKSVGKTSIHIQVVQDTAVYQVQVDITVKEPYIKIVTQDNEVSVGQSIGLKAKKYGTKSSVTWQVSDKKIAVIDKNQVLITKKRGTVTVTAKTKDGLTAKIKLKII
jgi:hypothetical protein